MEADRAHNTIIDATERYARDPRQVKDSIARPGKICQQDIRHSRLAIGASSNGLGKVFSGALPTSWSKTSMNVKKSISERRS